jgi:hypothetical protein
MAHELAHRMSVAPQEDEANFLAFLACRANRDRRVVYSGYFMPTATASTPCTTPTTRRGARW